MKNNGKISCFFLNFNYSSASLSLDISHPDFVSGFKNIRNLILVSLKQTTNNYHSCLSY